MSKTEHAPTRHATLFYVTPPDNAQKKGIINFLEKRYAAEVTLELKEDASLLGGFCIQVGSELFDWSVSERISLLKERLGGIEGTDNIVHLMQESISNLELLAKEKDIGTVTTIGDGIATIDGLSGATYGEILHFESGVKGMVQDLRRDSVGCILFDDAEQTTQNCRVIRTGKKAGIPVGDEYVGRVIDALGAPIDDLGDIDAQSYRPIEEPAPGVIDRQPVDTPLETGILAIDAMFPIGRGQRELIIGDRQTGKTAIAVDTILNQKGKDVICVYVAIGQKVSSVAQLVDNLRKRGAMEYTVVVNASASEPAPMQYIAPYSACALAEYFMNRGRDVLIVYDDLSKHAIAYRALSLLLERSPGREAYPGDVFYLHSRLLERSAHLSNEKGGGSLTALPIVETQAGDVSAYIPTNIISITDGQIFLEADLFFAEQRPAVNVGISISRVGGAAQTKAMKAAAGTIRLNLAQYREMEVFTQFLSDLDPATHRQLLHGQGLMQILRQQQFRSFSLHEQVIILVVAMSGIMLPLPAKEIGPFRNDLLTHFADQHADICAEIDVTKALNSNTRLRIVDIATQYRDAHLEQYRKEENS